MFTQNEGLYIAHGSKGPISIMGKMANRHGLIAGATGTGKTVTLQVLAESFCQAGVPCFMADMKGDLSGISQAGKTSSFIEKRQAEFGIENPQFQACPVRFFDVFGEQGHPMRSTVSDMGPQLLSRLLDLNETQSGILNIVFRIADDKGLLLIDMKDLRSMLDYVAKNASQFTSQYGNITAPSVGAIQRALLALENQGADKFFGEPAFDISDLLATEGGKGVMNVLAGDLEYPKLVFFFDEAHMLFDGTSKALVDKIEQVIRLIRSKGVGIYFVTQNPTDIPDVILGQLGNRVQHALRAFTPKDQKAVRAAAETFRANPDFKTEDAIQNLETGEALVSVLDEKGAPTVVERARILFPLSQIGAISPGQRDEAMRRSALYGKYDKTVDRESAFEVLLAESEAAEQQAAAEKEQKELEKAQAKEEKENGKKKSLLGRIGKALVTAVTATVATIIGTKVSNSITGKKTKTTKRDIAGRVARNTTSAVTRQITRDILGNLIR